MNGGSVMGRPSLCGESSINDHNGSMGGDGIFARNNSNTGFYENNSIHQQSRDSCLVGADNFQF
jgi:hypothetical protein